MVWKHGVMQVICVVKYWSKGIMMPRAGRSHAVKIIHTKYEVTIDIGYIKRSAKYGQVYLLYYYIQIGNERTWFEFDLCAIWMPDFWFLSILDPSSLWTVQMHSCIKYPIIWHNIHHYRHLRGRPHKNTPYLALTGELSSVFFKDFIRQLI